MRPEHDRRDRRRDDGRERRGEVRRGSAPIAVVLLVAIAVVLAGGIATATLEAPAQPAPTASLSLSVEGDRIELRHRAGDPIRIDDLTMRVRVDDEPLDRQPPVPFFSAVGFRPGPTGPFNVASDDVWNPGESASVTVAGTNDPTLESGRTVEVTLSVRGRSIVTLDATVRPA